MGRQCCSCERFDTAQKHSTYIGRETKGIPALRSVLAPTPQYGPAIRLKRDKQVVSFLRSDKRCRQKVMALSRVMPRYVDSVQNAKAKPLTGLGAYASLPRCKIEAADTIFAAMSFNFLYGDVQQVSLCPCSMSPSVFPNISSNAAIQNRLDTNLFGRLWIVDLRYRCYMKGSKDRFLMDPVIYASQSAWLFAFGRKSKATILKGLYDQSKHMLIRKQAEQFAGETTVQQNFVEPTSK